MKAQNKNKIKRLHACFEIFANELRWQIIEKLREMPMSVNELSDKIGAERSNVSHNLAMLKGCNIIDSRTVGKNRIYFIKDVAILQKIKKGTVLGAFEKHVKKYCTACPKTKKRTKS